MPYTKIRCSTCHDHMLGDNEPTPAEYARMILLDNHSDEWFLLMNNPHFGSGWVVGIEGTLEYNANPFPMGDPEVTDKRAWLFGFVAGKYSSHAGFATPVCMDPNFTPADGNEHDDGENVGSPAGSCDHCDGDHGTSDHP